MITLSAKKSNLTSSPLNLAPTDAKPVISFSELLKGIGKEDKADNGVLVLALQESSQSSENTSKKLTKESQGEFISLLKNNPQESDISNIKTFSSLSSSDMKTLISNAKNYLKTKILQSDGYIKSEVSQLPKTLKGLAEMAKKFNIDVSKITIEEVQTNSKATQKPQLLPSTKSAAFFASKKETIANAEKTPLQSALKSTSVMLKSESMAKESVADSNLNKKEIKTATLKELLGMNVKMEEKAQTAPLEKSSTKKIEGKFETSQKRSEKLQTESVELKTLKNAQTAPLEKSSTKKIEGKFETSQKRSEKVQTESVELKTSRNAQTKPLEKDTLKETQGKFETSQKGSEKLQTESVELKTPRNTQTKPLKTAQMEQVVAEKFEAKPAQAQSNDSSMMKQQAIDVKDQTRLQKNQAHVFQQEPVIAPKEMPLKDSTQGLKAHFNANTLGEKVLSVQPSNFQVKSSPSKNEKLENNAISAQRVLQTGNPNLTSDFSVASARVIASTTPTESQQNLESLLRGETGESSTPSKSDGVTLQKADSFEVKINEAKQMIKYLSSDVKTAIEDYKAPFTRVKVQLNPQNLGEVDVTIVQRGKNLHVNIGSNSAAINALALNANELKTQLSNSGINNATLNFNNSSQESSSGGNFSDQQQRRQGEQASREYNYFEKEIEDEEILSSLDIIVHNYA